MPLGAGRAPHYASLMKGRPCQARAWTLRGVFGASRRKCEGEDSLISSRCVWPGMGDRPGPEMLWHEKNRDSGVRQAWIRMPAPPSTNSVTSGK